MKVTKMKLSKSRTFGVTVNLQTKYQKVSIELEAQLSSDELPLEAEQNLSGLIDSMLTHEYKKLNNIGSDRPLP